LALAGAITFALGLAGGWWMSRNATAPITKMSETASKISANNLSNRMNLDGVDSELSDLGMVLNNMLDRLDQAFEQQKQFTADASHELRTPLAGLLATTELSLAKDRTPDEYRKHLQYCFINATRMQKLVEGLLVLARLDHHDGSANLEPIALMPVLENCVQATELIASEKQVQVHLPPISEKVLGNANQLERVFTNLIENAIRYNRQGGQVWIESKMLGSSIAISVRDNGLGIEPSDQAKIMNRFFRVEAARTHSGNGYGLGLSIAKRIVDLHHGELRLESKLSVGSTFTVVLPAYLESTNENK
jgi:heavy metal sensor kinase